MPTDPTTTGSSAPDASDVISGAIGDASLRDPATSGPEGAELDKLPAIDADAAASTAAPTEGAALVPTGYDPNAAIRQLEAILQNLTNYATPVLREIAARAAELAAKAGEAAGPAAHKAASVTEEVGGRIAAKGREVASGLRGDGPHDPDAAA